MATDFVRSQGTEIFVVVEPAGAVALKMSCPLSATKSGGARSMVEILCLDAEDPEFVSGARSATTWSVPFALVPTDNSHQALFDLEDSGDTVTFLIALSDGIADPTVAAGVMTPPTGRSSFMFEAIVMEVGIDIASSDVVRGTLSLQVSGPITRTWAA